MILENFDGLALHSAGLVTGTRVTAPNLLRLMSASHPIGIVRHIRGISGGIGLTDSEVVGVDWQHTVACYINSWHAFKTNWTPGMRSTGQKEWKNSG